MTMCEIAIKLLVLTALWSVATMLIYFSITAAYRIWGD